MQVAYELGKTVDELDHLSLEDLADWLAFFRLRQKYIDQDTAARRREQQMSRGRR